MVAEAPEKPMKATNAVVMIREYFTKDGEDGKPPMPPDMAEMKKLTMEDREELGTAIAIQWGGTAVKQADGTMKYTVPA